MIRKEVLYNHVQKEYTKVCWNNIIFLVNENTQKVEIAPGGLDNCVFCGECSRYIDNEGEVMIEY